MNYFLLMFIFKAKLMHFQTKVKMTDYLVFCLKTFQNVKNGINTVTRM